MSLLQSKKIVNDMLKSVAPEAVRNEIRENGNPPPQMQYFRSAHLNILAQTGPVYIRTGDLQLTKNNDRPPLFSQELHFRETNNSLINQSSPAIVPSVFTDRN